MMTKTHILVEVKSNDQIYQKIYLFECNWNLLQIDCWNKWELNYTGKLLLDHYNSYDKVIDLFQYGDIESLWKTVWEAKNFNCDSWALYSWLNSKDWDWFYPETAHYRKDYWIYNLTLPTQVSNIYEYTEAWWKYKESDKTNIYKYPNGAYLFKDNQWYFISHHCPVLDWYYQWKKLTYYVLDSWMIKALEIKEEWDWDEWDGWN